MLAAIRRSSIGTRKSTLRRKRAAKSKISQFKKPLIAGTLAALILWAGLWFFLSDMDTRLMSAAKNQTLKFTAKAGFRVDNLLVEGRKYTDAQTMLALMNIQKGDPIFLLDPVDAKTQIEKIGWVKSARVERRLPDTVYIRLEERNPIALWKNENALSLIDYQGVILTRSNLSAFKDYFMVDGAKAPEQAAALINMLSKQPDIMAMVDHAEYIDGRRWDLLLTDGKRIKLPESGIDLALKALAEKHGEDQVLTKEAIRDIDARYQGRLIIRTRLGTVQDYKSKFSETSL